MTAGTVRPATNAARRLAVDRHAVRTPVPRRRLVVGVTMGA